MKKIIVILILILSIIATQITTNATNQEPKYKDVYDTLITTLYPYIREEISNYYGYNKQLMLYSVDLDIKRVSGYSFEVEVKVRTFEHAHNPPHGIETITFSVSPSGVELLEYDHLGDEYEKLILEFSSEIIKDIKQSFNLDLDTYSKYSFDQLLFLAEKHKEYSSLSDIALDIVVNVLNPDLKPPYKNFTNPVTFINGNNAYILFKKSDGTNTVYKVVKENDKWKVIEQKSKIGKKMDNKLLWYM
ncbi:DUF3888 domain-containing protein [Mycoplasmatota bacterium zrk1]